MVPRPPRLPHTALALAAAISLVAAACGNPAPTTSPAASPGAGPGSTATIRVYFFVASGDGASGLVPVERTVPADEPADALPRDAVEALLKGPTTGERGAQPAMSTLLPDELRLFGVQIDGGVATVDLSDAINQLDGPGDDWTTIRRRLAQIVFTLTQFPAVTGVMFKTEGGNQDVAGLDHNPIFRPLTRLDYTDALPDVFLDEPAWGSNLPNPAHLVGLANVFEANFHVRILDAGDHSLADGPVLASCGTGCWGTFDVSVPYSVNAPAPGTLQAYVLSAVDGSIVDLRSYPVSLTP